MKRTACHSLAFGLILGLLPGLAAPCLAQAGEHVSQLPELNWEKRLDWIDVTKDVTPGALGDGKADDTAAVQRCIDAARQHGKGAIAYLPRGTYRVSKTIRITGRGKRPVAHAGRRLRSGPGRLASRGRRDARRRPGMSCSRTAKSRTWVSTAYGSGAAAASAAWNAA